MMTDLTLYGFNKEDYFYGPEAAQGKIPARITAVHRERFELVCEHGIVYGRLKDAEYYTYGEVFPTAGDFVLIDYIKDGDSRIVRTLKRRSYFSRLDPSSGGHGEQAVAANFDYVFIMQSLNDDFNIRRLERYLTLSLQSGASPVVILTKADLSEYSNPALIEERISAAKTAAIGIPVIAVSAKSGYGLEQLDPYLEPKKTIVFLGSSGVGKSSLVNSLAGEEIMAVNSIREDDSKGRHTTTHRQLIMLSRGVMIIDTPGMRELGMFDVSDGLGASFADVEKYFGLCKFRDCTHKSEPGCAILAAIERGELSAERWRSYKNLENEALIAESKPEYDRKKQEWGRNIAKVNKQREMASKKYGGKR